MLSNSTQLVSQDLAVSQSKSARMSKASSRATSLGMVVNIDDALEAGGRAMIPQSSVLNWGCLQVTPGCSWMGDWSNLPVSLFREGVITGGSGRELSVTFTGSEKNLSLPLSWSRDSSVASPGSVTAEFGLRVMQRHNQWMMKATRGGNPAFPGWSDMKPEWVKVSELKGPEDFLPKPMAFLTEQEAEVLFSSARSGGMKSSIEAMEGYIERGAKLLAPNQCLVEWVREGDTRKVTLKGVENHEISIPATWAIAKNGSQVQPGSPFAKPNASDLDKPETLATFLQYHMVRGVGKGGGYYCSRDLVDGRGYVDMFDITGCLNHVDIVPSDIGTIICLPPFDAFGGSPTCNGVLYDFTVLCQNFRGWGYTNQPDQPK